MRLVKNRILAFAGLVMVAAVALALLRGSVTLTQGAVRLGIGVAMLMVADRIVVPLFLLLVPGPSPRSPEDDDHV